MRLSTDEDRDQARAEATIAAAAAAGITVFDTAHAYAQGEHELGHNERLLAGALRRCGAAGSARIVTKGGMTRAGGGWLPDGRAKTILRDCEASLVALDGLAIDLYLIHAPDPRTPWRTSLRALARLRDEGLVKRVGVANVNRRQLDEALEIAPIAAAQVALSVHDDRAVRGGILERCSEMGIALIAHSPLGGPRRAGALRANAELGHVASAHAATPAEVALAWLLHLSASLVAIPGARHPETARSATRSSTLTLTLDELAAIAGPAARTARPKTPRRKPGAEVVLVMGIPGAGKSRLAERYIKRGYTRLNRDERGGNLTALATALDDELAGGAERVVLDNTYLTRASRSYVIEVAHGHGVRSRCVWLDIPLAQAQVNLVERLLARFGSLPAPDELRKLARQHPGLLLPTAQMRSVRELEPPSLDEGFAAIQRLPFTRASRAQGTRGAVFVAAAAMRAPDWGHVISRGETTAPHLIFDWSPGAPPDALAPLLAALERAVAGPVEAALCPHAGGPPRCWCRPPLPGLPRAFAHRHAADCGRSVMIGTSPAHRTLAASLGARYLPADIDERA
jgi:aryl-alcohol dehydrogenase-like predicted oxidoreductase